jgi:HPt (histidine-containing phosphotransfer) domain-containing protein
MGKDETAVLDRVTFDDFAGLFNDSELREVIEEWHADSANALAALAAAHASGDNARIGALAHRAAGGALAIGATTLAEACERLRASAESGAAVTDDELAPVRAAVAATYAALTAAAAG